MEKSHKKITLNNKKEIPIIGLGTAKIDNCETMVYEAISNGYRMIDTAEAYGNEPDVGRAISRAIKENIVKREDLCIITKINTPYHSKPEESVDKQLKDLQLDYIDLYLVHTPCNQYFGNTETFEKVPLYQLWAKLESLVEKGLVKSLGVSNYSVQLLLDLLTYCTIKPVVNEVEYHPYLVQQDLKDFCEKQGIRLIAYNSLVLGTYSKKDSEIKTYNLLGEDVIKETAKKYSKSEGQVCLNWAISQNNIVIPKTSNIERLKENLASDKFELDKEDIEKISKLNRNKRFLTTKTNERYGYVNLFA